MTFGLRIVTVFAHMYGIHGTICVVSTWSIAGVAVVPRVADLRPRMRRPALSMLGMLLRAPLDSELLHLRRLQPDERVVRVTARDDVGALEQRVDERRRVRVVLEPARPSRDRDVLRRRLDHRVGAVDAPHREGDADLRGVRLNGREGSACPRLATSVISSTPLHCLVRADAARVGVLRLRHLGLRLRDAARGRPAS